MAHEKRYVDILKEILSEGTEKPSRTGNNTISVFGRQYHFKMADGFPIPTVRYQPFKTIVRELLWFIQGSDKCDFLDEHHIKIWKEWTDPKTNSIGPIYPVQLRHWIAARFLCGDDLYRDKKFHYLAGKVKDSQEAYHFGLNRHLKDMEDLDIQFDYESNNQDYQEEDTTSLNLSLFKIDQLQEVIEGIKEHPFSRRHIVSYWNPAYLPDESISPIDNVQLGNMALAPCHTLFQFNVSLLNTREALKQSVNRSILEDLFKMMWNETLETPSNEISNEQYDELILYAKEEEIDLETAGLKREALSLQLYMRSNDAALGMGFNISQYSLLLYMVAGIVDMIPYEYIHTVGDLHIYKSALPVIMPLLKLKELPAPTLIFNPKENIDDYTEDDFSLSNYQYLEKVKIPVEI